MTDNDAIAAALARLANGTAGSTDRPRPGRWTRQAVTDDEQAEPPPASVVADARDALTRLPTAAAFVDSGGQRQLARAVTDAERAGDSAVADRGRNLLATLDRFRATAASNGERGFGNRGRRDGQEGFE